MEQTLTWEQQEVFRLLKSQPGTTYQESDESGRMIFRDWIRNLLNVSEITVTFVKADGTLRDMRCTLDSDRIPPQPPRAEKPAKEAPVDGLRQNGFLGEAEKVNKLSSIIWSGSATKKDSIALKNALLKKDQLCQPIQQSKDNAIQELRGTCQ